MKNILMDMHLIESRSYRIPNGDSSKQVTKASYQFIFKKYKIDTAQLRSSLEYYLGKPEIMDKMYEEMLDSLSKKQSQLVKSNRPTLSDTAKKPAKPHSVKDSIMRVRDSVMNRFHIKKSPVKK